MPKTSLPSLFIERTAATGILGVKITQNGEDMGKHLWDEECRRNIYSASKSFTSAAVGIAVKEGLLRLEERLVDAFSEDIPENPNEFNCFQPAQAPESGYSSYLLFFNCSKYNNKKMKVLIQKSTETFIFKAIILSYPFCIPPVIHRHTF